MTPEDLGSILSIHVEAHMIQNPPRVFKATMHTCDVLT